jgi:hypothetical protein
LRANVMRRDKATNATTPTQHSQSSPGPKPRWRTQRHACPQPGSGQEPIHHVQEPKSNQRISIQMSEIRIDPLPRTSSPSSESAANRPPPSANPRQAPSRPRFRARRHPKGIVPEADVAAGD